MGLRMGEGVERQVNKRSLCFEEKGKKRRAKKRAPQTRARAPNANPRTRPGGNAFNKPHATNKSLSL